MQSIGLCDIIDIRISVLICYTKSMYSMYINSTVIIITHDNYLISECDKIYTCTSTKSLPLIYYTNLTVLLYNLPFIFEKQYRKINRKT